MKVTLADGTTYEAVNVTGEGSYLQGAQRDTLSFAFLKDKYTLAKLDKAFTAENCSKITLTDSNTEAVHDNYTIRVSLTLAPVVIIPETSTAPAVTEERITVTMAQKTYLETQIEALTKKISAEE